MRPAIHARKTGRLLGRVLVLLALAWSVACTSSPTEQPQYSASPAPDVTASPVPSPLPSAVPIATATPEPQGLFVDGAISLGEISRLNYGANHGPWSTVPYDLQAMAEAAGITYLRFPGGNWGDQNDLTARQVDQFIVLARNMGAEPSISVRLPGGTPQQAAGLVRYANVEMGYGVRYWSIGNEPSLYDDYDTERYNAEWRRFAEAMRAVDPSILLVGPDIHQYTGTPNVDPRDAQGRDWLHEFLTANGDLVDVVSIHRYPFPASMAGPATTIGDLAANSREWDTIIPNLRADVRQFTGRDLPIAVTEVNSHWTSAVGGQATPDSFYNAIWWGDVLGRLIAQGVDIVAYFALQSPNALGGWGLLASYDVRPTYHVYQLYQRFGDELLHAVSDDPSVSIYAARRDDGAVTILLVNLSAEAKEKPLTWSGFPTTWPTGPAEIWLFDVDHKAEPIAGQTLVNGETITVPPQSISLYVLP